jgi:hypothetical protein
LTNTQKKIACRSVWTGISDRFASKYAFEVFRKIDEETLLHYKAKKESGEDTENDLENLPDENKAAV